MTSEPLDGRVVNNWVGEWFRPIVGNHYYIPTDTANHKDWAGLTGMCTKVRSNGTGMHWAHLICTSAGIDKRGWIRTKHLQPLQPVSDARYNGSSG